MLLLDAAGRTSLCDESFVNTYFLRKHWGHGLMVGALGVLLGVASESL